MNSLERGQGILEEFHLNSDVASRALDLSSEVGELCKEILKSTNYGSSTFKSTENLELELGDVMVSLLLLGSSLNLDLDVALEKSLQKMRARVQDSGSVSSSNQSS
jgi:NTP pyrophosphatase (non-canonical NTP hydrolase)